MRATRRNVLVILGVLTIAGGALFGTGAFTQVEAQRSVEMDTAGDASAQLGLEITNDDLAGDDGSSGTIAFDESQLNQNATTEYEGAFVVSNNDDDSTSISSLSIEDADGNSVMNNDTSVLSFENASYSGGSLASDEQVTFDVVIDTTNGDISEVPSEITIVADA